MISVVLGLALRTRSAASRRARPPAREAAGRRRLDTDRRPGGARQPGGLAHRARRHPRRRRGHLPQLARDALDPAELLAPHGRAPLVRRGARTVPHPAARGAGGADRGHAGGPRRARQPARPRSALGARRVGHRLPRPLLDRRLQPREPRAQRRRGAHLVPAAAPGRRAPFPGARAQARRTLPRPRGAVAADRGGARERRPVRPAHPAGAANARRAAAPAAVRRGRGRDPPGRARRVSLPGHARARRGAGCQRRR